MKIGIDARPLSSSLTGIGTYLYSVLEEMAAQDDGHEYYLYSHAPLKTPPFSHKRFHVSLYPSRIGTWGYCFKLPQLLKRDGIEVFWGTQHILPFFNPHIHYLLTLLDFTVYRFPQSMTLYNYGIHRLFFKSSVKKADQLLAISASTKSDAEYFLGPLKNRPTVVYGASNLRAGDKALAEKFLEKKYGITTAFILYVGTVEPRKNLETLLKAYAQALQDGHMLPILVIAGKKGWKTEEVYRLAACLKEHVLFLGYIDDETKGHLYTAADFFVYPSLFEGFGLPVLEAMQCGLPVITSNSSSLPEVAGDACLLFDPLDETALKKHLITLSNDKSLQNSLKEKGLKQAARFSWRQSAEQIRSLLVS